MYIYYVLINTLSTHMIYVNYDILYTCRAQSYQNNLHKVLYGKTNTTCGSEIQMWGPEQEKLRKPRVLHLCCWIFSMRVSEEECNVQDGV